MLAKRMKSACITDKGRRVMEAERDALRAAVIALRELTTVDVADTAEEWRPAPGHEDRYLVSNLGRIKSLPNGQSFDERVLTPRKRGGYMVVNLYEDGRKEHRITTVHRLVLMAFSGPAPADKPMCCHMDGDGTNNVISNLRWGSAYDNAQDMIAHGRSVRGTKNALAKLNDDTARQVKILLRQGRMTCKEIAATFGVSPSAITSIKNGRTWTWLSTDPAPPTDSRGAE